MTYEPYREADLYPGARVPAERRAALENLEINEIDELTLDDLAYLSGTNWTRIAYTFIRVLEEKLGEERTQELVGEMAYRGGIRRIQQWLEKNGAERLTPELMMRFQDHSHLTQGANHACSFMEYVPGGCVLRRTACGWHDGRPEDATSYCRFTSEAFFQAYRDTEPDLTIEIPACRSRGTSEAECEIHYIWRSLLEAEDADGPGA
jgi:hypothetical protein